MFQQGEVRGQLKVQRDPRGCPLVETEQRGPRGGRVKGVEPGGGMDGGESQRIPHPVNLQKQGCLGAQQWRSVDD